METYETSNTAEVQDEPKKPADTKATEKPDRKDAEIEKLKAALNKASADAADWKRQFREKQTEQERTEAERAEADKQLREELETLRKEKAVADYSNRCVTIGFDGELAAMTANAIADGNMDAMFDCLKQFVEATKTKMANDALNKQPTLSAGVPPTAATTIDKDYEQMRRWMMGASK